MTTIIYHRNCTDGFASAWVTLRGLERRLDGKLEGCNFHACNYQEPFTIPAEHINGHDVYVVDFSFEREITIDLAKRASKLVCLDHHDGTPDRAGGIEGCILIYDKDRCGAQLCWDFFFPDSPLPELVQYAQDYDLWRFKLPDSRLINSALQSYPFDFDVYDDLCQRMARNLSSFIAEGSALQRQKDKEIALGLSLALPMIIEGHKVKGVNSPAHISEIGNALAKDNPFGVVFFMRSSGLWSISMRSDNKINVTKIAQKFGGGGHPSGNTASFRVDDIYQFLAPEVLASSLRCTMINDHDLSRCPSPRALKTYCQLHDV